MQEGNLVKDKGFLFLLNFPHLYAWGKFGIVNPAEDKRIRDDHGIISIKG